MDADAALDGFTITGVGLYDENKWNKHYATQGNMQSHEHIGVSGTAGIEVRHSCEVKNNIVHHVGYTGIEWQLYIHIPWLGGAWRGSTRLWFNDPFSTFFVRSLATQTRMLD